MSNLLKAITFLKSSPEDRFLAICDENSNVIGIEKVYLKNIPNENLEAYLKLHLGKQEQDVMLWIEAREKSGATDKKRGSFPVRIDAEVQPVQQIQSPMQQSTNFLGQAVQSEGTNILMPASAVMDMQRKADRLDDANEKIAELRAELQRLNTKIDSEALDFKKERNDSDTELRDLRSRLHTAEKEKEIAVKEIQKEKRNFLDSEGFQKFLDKAPQMLGNIVAMKTGVPPMGESLGAASTLSETKQQFLEYMTDHMDDKQVLYIGSVIHFLDNPEFKNYVDKLVTDKVNGN